MTRMWSGSIDVSVYLLMILQNPNQVFNLSIGENSLVSISGIILTRIDTIHSHDKSILSDRSYEQIKLDLIYNDYQNIVTCGGTFDYWLMEYLIIHMVIYQT